MVIGVRRRLLMIPAILVAMPVTLTLALAGCGAGASSKAPGAVQSARRTGTPTKVLVVIEENHSLAQMRAGMPFLARQSSKYGYATHWKALTHPSEPNYLAIVGGSTFGVTDDETPQVNAGKVGAAPAVFDPAPPRRAPA